MGGRCLPKSVTMRLPQHIKKEATVTRLPSMRELVGQFFDTAMIKSSSSHRTFIVPIAVADRLEEALRQAVTRLRVKP